MLFARALSLLARRLFADVIGGAYVEGELEDCLPEEQKVVNTKNLFLEEEKKDTQFINQEQLNIFEELLKQVPEYASPIEGYLKQNNIKDFASMPIEMYESFVLKMKTFLQKKQEKSEKESKNIKTSTKQVQEVVNG